MKKAIALLLAAVMYITLLPAPAKAADLPYDDDYWYNLTLAEDLPYKSLEYDSDGYIIVTGKDSKKGIIDIYGNVIIPPKYRSVSYAKEGMFKVAEWIDGASRCGFVDINNNLVVPMKYVVAYNFSSGLAAVQEKHDGPIYFINKKGETVISSSDYDRVNYISQHKYLESSNGYFYGFDSYALSDGLLVVEKDGKSLALDANGNVVFEYDSLSMFSDGIASFYDKGNNINGYINRNGELLFEKPVKDGYTEAFIDGYAIIHDRKTNQCGLIDSSGNIVVPIEYSGVGRISEGMACVKNTEGKFGYFDLSTGEEAIPTIYDGALPFSEGLAAVSTFNMCDDDGEEFFKWGFVDKKGNMVIPQSYEIVNNGFTYGYAKVTVNKGWTYLKNYYDVFGDKVRTFYIDTSGRKYDDDNSKNIDFYGKICIRKNGDKYSIVRNPFYKETAVPTSSTVKLNGKDTEFDAYTINQNNYFKLRDLAAALSGTGKQFEVTWDGSTSSIQMFSGRSYTTIGDETGTRSEGNKDAYANTAKVCIDGKRVRLLAYTINGNNYFKLRDVGEAFDFDVTWDGETQTILINTERGYTNN